MPATPETRKDPDALAARHDRHVRMQVIAIPVFLAAVFGMMVLVAIALSGPVGTTAGISHAAGVTGRARLVVIRRAHVASSGSQDGLHAVWGDPRTMPSLGGRGAVVAIVDSGADLQHPSLQGHLWTNPGEIAGNGIDDDQNGYVDDVHGVNILSPAAPPDDGYGHGTAVAGLVAAGDDAATAVTGAAPGAQLMIVRVLGSDGAGNTEELAAGIAYAVRNGASVINCSVNSEFDSPAVDSAVDSADAAGIPVVAAAGNDGLNLDENATYPAETDSDAIIAVAATSSPGQLAAFSSYGAHSVDLAAPGVDLVTILPGNSFTTLTGTSASTPLVSATLANELALRPEATLPQVRSALLVTTSHRDVGVISGELDAPAAIENLIGPSLAAAQLTPTLKVAPTLVRHGRRVVVRAHWSVKVRLLVPLRAVVRVRAGSGHGRVLSARRVMLRGKNGTVRAATVSRRRSAARFWIELQTTRTTGSASVRFASLIRGR